MPIYTKRCSRAKKEIAQTLVEFAIVFPVLLLITYGIIEFGRMLFIYIEVTNAAREGARYGAAVGDSVNGIPQYRDCGQIKEAAADAAILTIIPTDTIEITYAPNHLAGFIYTCSDIGSHISELKDGPRIKVIVHGRYAPIIPFLGLNQTPVVITRQNARTIIMDIEIDR